MPPVPPSADPPLEADAPAAREEPGHAALLLALDGFEGPIDLLLTLAREQKLDLTRIPILQLADQYLAFIAEARQIRLELAADYLVMAAWLAYLKSRILLPEPESEEPSGEELAAALGFQLQRLEAIRTVSRQLMALPRLGREVFPRGAPEGLAVTRTARWQASLYDLLKAYGDHRRRQQTSSLQIAPNSLYSLEDALERLNRLLGPLPEDWNALSRFLPPEAARLTTLRGRSALAAYFVATLELAKAGQIDVRQDRPFGPLYLRRRPVDSPDS